MSIRLRRAAALSAPLECFSTTKRTRPSFIPPVMQANVFLLEQRWVPGRAQPRAAGGTARTATPNGPGPINTCLLRAHGNPRPSEPES